MKSFSSAQILYCSGTLVAAQIIIVDTTMV